MILQSNPEMAIPCSSKPKKLSLAGNENPWKCRFKVQFPPIQISQDANEKMKKERSSQVTVQKVRGKLGFQCHFEDRLKRAEARRRKVLQKLKEHYNIDLEGLNEYVTREIILKTRMMEKEKKEREKRKTERMVAMISRLMEEEKYKNQGRVCFWKKTLKSLSTSKRVKEVPETAASDALMTDELQTEPSDDTVPMNISDLELPESTEFDQEDETELPKQLPKCVEKKKPPKDSPEIIPYANIIRKHTAFSVTLENCLESVPKCVTFKDYKKNKVYLQNLQIRSISCETIHCRYLGIIVQTKGEEKFPIGVAVRDNVKLRPGLYCSTKIRLCSKDDKKELKCSIVYETRRQKNPSHRSLFFVPVVCVPVRAIVKVIPLKITFPSLTWCEATGPEGAKLFIKRFRIENSGGKACSCRISKMKHETEVESVKCYGESEGEGESLKNKLHKWEGRSSRNKTTYDGEFPGEGYLTFYDNPEEAARRLVDEMVEFACAAFRFSKIFYIEIPPFSTTYIQVKFAPFYKGFHYETYYLLFEDCDNTTEEIMEIMGKITQIPLRAEPEVIDLKTCIANSGVYADTFKVFNESKGPYSVVLKVPPPLKNHAHVYPRASTILPLKSSDFSVRIYPRVTLAKDAFSYYNKDSQVLEFPIFIYPANSGVCKRDCLKIYVLALITDYCLSLSPSSIYFGVVTTLETVRTELELTNHSLAVQEYGFLNLPKGVRVEPGMGFGKILPKETITLCLLYSPGDELLEDEDHDFQVTVSSIAEYGGFKEKLEVQDDFASKTIEFIWGEDYHFEFPNETSGSEFPAQFMQPEDSVDFNACEEESSIEGEEYCSKLYQEENKIREYLRDVPKLSDHSYNKRMPSQMQNNFPDFMRESISEYGEYEELKSSKSTPPPKTCFDTVHCRASVIKPRCRLSATVIQLPATSCSSFTLYRFRLHCIKIEENVICPCGFRKVVKCGEDHRNPSSFEFQYNCRHIKLEPQSGFIKPGDDIPITIIHRPEYTAEQLQQVPSPQKMRSTSDTKAESQSAIVAKKIPHSSKSKLEMSNKNSLEVMMFSELDLSGDKNLGRFMNPFIVETKIQCVVKTKFCGGQTEKTEIHEMVVICPVIQPNFIYLGNSQEIKFNKVFVGTKSRMILQIQSNSIERTSPSATLLNPVGPFYCPAGVAQVVLDPEHIWQQPLIYAPLEENGIEKQFFEIYCGTTNVFLTVSGEAIRPEYNIIPDFEFCIIEAKPGRPEELKLDIENFSAITLIIYIEINFEKEGPDLERISKLDEVSLMEEPKKEKKEDLKDKKKSKNPENEIYQMWGEIPEAVSMSLPKFEDVDEENKMFTLMGVDEDNKIQILPSGKEQIRIIFKPPEETSDRSFLVKYSFTLERASLLKEILLMGKITKGIQK